MDYDRLYSISLASTNAPSDLCQHDFLTKREHDFLYAIIVLFHDIIWFH